MKYSFAMSYFYPIFDAGLTSSMGTFVKIVGATEDGVQLANAASCVIADDDQDVLLHSFSRWLNAFDSGTEVRFF